jgi:acyl carrier protein
VPEPAAWPTDSSRKQAELEVRRLLAEHGGLTQAAERIALDADLFDAGLSSIASVTLMLALEQAFGVEFGEELLTRSTFSSIEAILAALPRASRCR